KPCVPPAAKLTADEDAPEEMWKEVMDREEGVLRPAAFCERVRRRRVAAIDLSNRKEIVSAHRGGVNSLQVDLTECRFLLSGASDGSAAVYDIQHPTDHEGGGRVEKHRCLFVVDKQHGHGHKFAVSSVAWYPVDTGLFITGSFDHHIKVWDTNTTQVVMDFKMPGKVYGTAMSAIATTHMLIAAGTEDVQVRLCDIASGAFTHTLSGHRVWSTLYPCSMSNKQFGLRDLPQMADGIMAVEWSTSSEWVLMTGGCDGAIRFWDIRRAGCFLVLDQSQTQFGRRPPFSESSLKQVSLSQLISMRETSPANKIVSHQKKPHGRGANKLPIFHQGIHRKGSNLQRLHPGMSSSRNRATAHYGSVTGLRPTEDGMYLLSTGSDSRLRLWDIESGCNTLVNFEATHLQTKSLQLAVTEDSSLVFVPCMTALKAFDMWSGTTFRVFRGHYESVNCCFFNSHDQELYTGSNDRQILVWSPPSEVIAEGDELTSELHNPLADQDQWSD
ncbi:hypothetical protein Taro_009216, partial [Colocasia esculenta]|nr:hypothetical protein [Colocasia esculenta]